MPPIGTSAGVDGRSDLEPFYNVVEPLTEPRGDFGPGSVARLRQSEFETDRFPT